MSWTHYQSLLRVEDSTARTWYLNEAASQNWSSRALDHHHQINWLDLKPGELTHRPIGQMDMCVRMDDDQRCDPKDKPTVGIILCASKDASVVRFSVLHGNEQLFANRYRLILLTEEELRVEIIREQRLLDERAEARLPRTGA